MAEQWRGGIISAKEADRYSFKDVKRHSRIHQLYAVGEAVLHDYVLIYEDVQDSIFANLSPKANPIKCHCSGKL